MLFAAGLIPHEQIGTAKKKAESIMLMAYSIPHYADIFTVFCVFVAR